MKLALGQLNSGSDVSKNLSAILKHISFAARRRADLITFPENAFYMGNPNRLYEVSIVIFKNALPRIQEAARNAHIAVLIGSVPERSKMQRKVFNTSLFIDAAGTVKAKYRKTHLFNVRTPAGEVYRESRFVQPGKAWKVFRWKGIRFGMSVCYDLRFPEMYRHLAKQGADVLLVPSAFTKETGKDHWHTLLRARAIENLAHVVAPAQTGAHPMKRRTFGHSLVIGPWGEILSDGGTTPGVTFAEITPAISRALRAQFKP